MIIEIELGVLRLEVDDLSIAALDGTLDEAMRQKQREVFVSCLEKQDVLNKAARTCWI